jgi:hypothetical protein
MSFMQKEITERMSGWRVETDFGTEYVPGYVESNPSRLANYVEGKIESVEEVLGYFGRLSAPGYMDRTEWEFSESQAEVEEVLDELYGGDEEDESEDTEDEE